MTKNHVNLLSAAMLATSLSLSACTPAPILAPAASGQTTPAEGASLTQPATSVFPTNVPIVPTENVAPKPGGDLVANNTGSLGGSGGGSLIANNSAQLTGVVKAPQHLIANNSGSLIANNSGSLIANNSGSLLPGASGYRVFSTGSEVAAPDMVVTLRRADGTYVKDASGNILSAKTDNEGRYLLQYPVNNGENLVLHVLLVEYGQADTAKTGPYTIKGDLLGFVPNGGGGQRRGVDLNTNSSVVLSYVMSNYVMNNQIIFNRLTSALEQETRQIFGTASADIAPTDLTPAKVTEAVNAERSKPAIDTQLEIVKRALLIGLPNQGAMGDIHNVATDAFSSVAVNHSGQVIFVGRGTKRVWMRSADNKYVPVAGTGLVPVTSDAKQLSLSAPAPGDGGPATSAAFWPTFLAVDTAGDTFVTDESHRRIRKVDKDGIITTYAAHAEWDNFRGVVFAPDGSLLVATYSAIYKVAPGGGATTRVAGAHRLPLSFTPTGVGTDIFADIRDIAMDTSGTPTTNARYGTVYVKDYSGRIFQMPPTGLPSELVLRDGQMQAVTLTNAGGIAVDVTGKLLVVDSFKSLLFKVDPANGVLVPFAGTPGKAGLGGDGGPALGSRLGLPCFVYVDRNGDIYMSDTGLVRMIPNTVLPTRTISTVGAGAMNTVTITQSASSPVYNIYTVAGKFEPNKPTELLKDVRLFYPTRLLHVPAAGPRPESILFTDGFGIRSVLPNLSNFGNSPVALVSSQGLPTADSPVDGKDPSSGLAINKNLMLFGPLTADAVTGQLYYTAVNEEVKQYIIKHDPLTGTVSTVAGGQSTQWDGTPLPAVQAANATQMSAYHLYNDMVALPNNGGLLYSMVSSANGSGLGAKGALALVKDGQTTPLIAQAASPISAMLLVPTMGGLSADLYLGIYGAILKIDMTPWLAYMANPYHPIANPTGVQKPALSLDPMAPSGFTVVAGSIGLDNGTHFKLPSGLVLHLDGGVVPHLYFSDPLNGKVRKFNMVSNTLSLVAGKGASNLNGDTVDDGLLTPHGLAFDTAGNLYIADNEHHQIKVLKVGTF